MIGGDDFRAAQSQANDDLLELPDLGFDESAINREAALVVLLFAGLPRDVAIVSSFRAALELGYRLALAEVRT